MLVLFRGIWRSVSEDNPIDIHTLTKAQELTGESRHLINFLIRDRRIPVRKVGPSWVLDNQGLDALKQALADYRSKGEPVSAT